MKRLILFLLASLTIGSTFAQKGRHLSVNFDLENNSWQAANLNKGTTNVNFIDLQYFHYGNKYFDHALFDVNISGFLSSLQKNNFQYVEDSSFQITNTNIVSLHMVNYFNEGVTRFGFHWGIDFMAKYLTTNATPGGWDPGDKGVDLSSLGIPLGLGAETALLDETLWIDGRMSYYFIYNSGYGGSGGFPGKGPQGKIRARYYISDFLFASGQVFYENISYGDANNANFSDGNASTTRLMFGLGIQF
jgi:hypothetical protein